MLLIVKRIYCFDSIYIFNNRYLPNQILNWLPNGCWSLPDRNRIGNQLEKVKFKLVALFIKR